MILELQSDFTREVARTIDRQHHRICRTSGDVHLRNCRVILQTLETVEAARHIEVYRVKRQDTNTEVRNRMRMTFEPELIVPVCKD